MIDNAALASLYGIDPLRFIKADPDDALMYQAIMQKAEQRMYKLQERQAELIAGKLARILGRMFK